jgi:hypothetical protein
MTNDFGSAFAGIYDFVWDYGTIESYSGSSGGPLWYSSNDGPYVAGIVSTDGWAVDVFAQRDNISDWIEGNNFLLDENQIPVASNDQETTVAGTQVTVDVLANDSDPDGDSLSLTNVANPANGTASITQDDEVRYTPESGFTGQDSFDYTVQDSDGEIDTASVTVDLERPQLDEVFRFYNTDAGGHFYTPSEAEAGQVRKTLPSFNDEGVGFKALNADPPEAHPLETDVFRFYNKDAGGHFYTASKAEADKVRNTLENFVDEGVGFRAFEEQVEGTIPVYRFYNTDAGGHFYTPSEAEAGQVRKTLPSFNDEGVGFFAYPSDFDVQALGLSNTDVDGMG